MSFPLISRARAEGCDQVRWSYSSRERAGPGMVSLRTAPETCKTGGMWKLLSRSCRDAGTPYWRDAGYSAKGGWEGGYQID